jgi:small-conductance mechanosensitive channel
MSIDHFRLPVILRKMLPTIILIVIAVLAGATDVFSEQVRSVVVAQFKQRAGSLMPFAINLLIVAILFNIAYLLYHPSVCWLERLLEKSRASDRAKSFTIKAVRLLYWSLAVIIIISLFVPELMGKVVLGFGVLGAAITLALQDAAKNFISGLRVHSMTDFRAGTEVKPIGSPNLELEGTIVDIGYLSTTVKTKDGEVTVPNTQLWERAVLRKKPEPSKIILPPGYDLDVEKPETDSKEKK